MKKKILKISFLAILFQSNLISISYAQGNSDVGFIFSQPQGIGVKSGIGQGVQAESLVQTILINVISIFFAVGGIGVVVYFIWGAVDWILSGGDKEKVAAARKKMTHAIIGLVLLSLSYVIINIIGGVVGFNPLEDLQLRGLGDTTTPKPNQ